jgi:predicted trehalose synthase
MNTRLSEQLEQVQRDLATNLAEVERIGESLIEVGVRLKQEPWKWTMEWAECSFPAGEWAHPVDPEMLEALDRNRISWLLEDIRILRRRESELKRLAVA